MGCPLRMGNPECHLTHAWTCPGSAVGWQWGEASRASPGRSCVTVRQRTTYHRPLTGSQEAQTTCTRAAILGFLLVWTAGRAAVAQTAPVFAGFTLGSTKADLRAHAFPCERPEFTNQFCWPSDSVLLAFRHDTLAEVRLIVTRLPQPLERLWDVEWRERTTSLLGIPDSVSLDSESPTLGGRPYLTATWSHAGQAWFSQIFIIQRRDGASISVQWGVTCGDLSACSRSVRN